MAAQAEGPAGTPSAQVVGNAFVDQYYHILHQSPESVYRFYQEKSVLSRPDSNGMMTSVTTMQGINEKILSLNYKDYIAEIKTADAQPSSGEGVTVLVTGCLTGRDNVRKKFVQSFFLAPQEKGFYVLNDVFRYVEENEPVERTPHSVNVINDSAASAPLTSDPAQPTHVPDNPGMVHETSLEEDLNNGAEVWDPSDNDGSVVEDEAVIEPPPHPMKSENIAAASVLSAPEGDAPKQSYASIVKVTKASPAPSTARAPAHNVQPTPSNSNQQSHGPPKPDPTPEPVVSSGETAPESSNEHVEVEGYSIYVRNLPSNATEMQLEHAFKKFGTIKQDGIQVRSNKQGFCYGFVEFESASSMTSALEASPIIIGNRKAAVEEKRTTTRVSSSGSSNIGGRGRYPSGRGSGGFRSDSFRGGRGGHYGGGGGRGYGRNGPGEYSTRNRRGGEGSYQRVYQNGAGRGGGGGGGHHQESGQK